MALTCNLFSSASSMEGATTVDSNAPHPAPFASKQDSVPLSFPAILRNPGLNGRFAHLTDTRAASPSVTAKKIGRRDENNGRRWVRRKENSMCTAGFMALSRLRPDGSMSQIDLSATHTSSLLRGRITAYSYPKSNRPFPNLCQHIYPALRSYQSLGLLWSIQAPPIMGASRSASKV